MRHAKVFSIIRLVLSSVLLVVALHLVCHHFYDMCQRCRVLCNRFLDNANINYCDIIVPYPPASCISFPRDIYVIYFADILRLLYSLQWVKHSVVVLARSVF